MTNPMTDEERERLTMNNELHDILRAVILVTSAAFLVVFLLLVVFVDDADANHQDPVCHQGTTLWLPPEALALHLDQQHVPVVGHETDHYGTCEGGDPNYDPTTTTTVPPTTTTTTTPVMLIPPVVISREIVPPTPVPADPDFAG